MATCLPGLQGFPIQVTGWQSIVDKSQYIIPNDISIQFSPSVMRIGYLGNGSFSINGTNTFFMGGTQYFVKTVRMCQAKQQGLLNSSGTPVGELQLWGFPTATTTSKNSIALLCIPILSGQESDAGKAFTDLIYGRELSLQSLLPSGSGTDIVRYTTCVETNEDTVSVVVGYWSGGLIINQQVTSVLSSILSRNDFAPGVPKMSNYQLLSSYVLTQGDGGPQGGKGQRTFQEKNGFLQPYSNAVALGATTPEFIAGFRLIKDFKEQSTTAKLETAGYKCIAIDRSRDIKNGKLQVDPGTGKRLDKEVDDANAVDNEGTPQATIPPKKIVDYIFITLGVILGVLLLSGVLYAIRYMFVTRKSMGLGPAVDETPATVAKIVAAGATAPVVGPVNTPGHGVNAV